MKNPFPFSGLEYWNSKSSLYALSSNLYKRWRKEMWLMIKTEYDLYDSDSDSDFFPDDDFLPSIKPHNKVPEAPIPQPQNEVPEAPTLPGSSAGADRDELRDLILSLSDKVDSLNPSGANQQDIPEIIQSLRDCFRCTVCTNVTFSILFCDSCQHNIGCVPCITALNDCPRCRAPIERRLNAYRITGLEEIFTNNNFQNE